MTSEEQILQQTRTPGPSSTNIDRERDFGVERQREVLEQERERERDIGWKEQKPAIKPAKPQVDTRTLERTKSTKSVGRPYEANDAYEAMPPPQLPNNGIERERKPYSRQTPVRKEDPSFNDSDDEYYQPPTQTRSRANTRDLNPDVIDPSYQIKKPMPRAQYSPPSPDGSPPPAVKNYSDLDREEEDLYQMMAAKQAEIAAIEERLVRQRAPIKQLPMSTNNNRSMVDRDKEEARERIRRAEEDWEREERERKKWAEAGRQRYEQDLGNDGARNSAAADYHSTTPISQYSWRESYGGAPAGPGGKRAVATGGRISGGGEWEEFKYDEVSPVRARKNSIEGLHRMYSGGGNTGWPSQVQDCGCGGYEHPSCGRRS